MNRTTHITITFAVAGTLMVGALSPSHTTGAGPNLPEGHAVVSANTAAHPMISTITEATSDLPRSTTALKNDGQIVVLKRH